MDVSTNAGDGRDELGRDLVVTIRIGPDGTVYFNDVTLDLLPVTLALNPDDARLRQRLEAARAFDHGETR